MLWYWHEPSKKTAKSRRRTDRERNVEKTKCSSDAITVCEVNLNAQFPDQRARFRFARLSRLSHLQQSVRSKVNLRVVIYTNE